MAKRYTYVILAIIALSFSACNLPTASVNAIETAAAQTVEAQLSQAVNGDPTQTPTADIPNLDSTPNDSTNPPSTNTSVPTSVPTQETVCDLAGFVTDVTIPDGTELSPGENFAKTWRLINNGSCSWTSGYQLVFFGGDQMGGPSSQQLTSTVINPGQSVDISVALTAPGAAGTYKGDWKIKNPSGVIFALNGGVPFFVEIKVVEATPTPTPSGPSTFTVTLTQIQDGSIRSDGQFLQFPNVGDLADNRGSQGFAQFDISGIPSNATITKIEVDFTDYDSALGDAFGSLSCLRTYVGNFFPLGAGDYISGSQIGALTRWCNLGELSTVSVSSDHFKSTLQAALGNTNFEIIIRFNTTETDSDGVADMIRFGDMKLKITYTTP